MATEKRLIDADALIKHLGEEPMVWCDGEAEIQERDDWRRFKAYIEAQDTIDAVEVVHGWWVIERSPVEAEFKCSECGFLFIDADSYAKMVYKYCPMCGAKMDGDGNA